MSSTTYMYDRGNNFTISELIDRHDDDFKLCYGDNEQYRGGKLYKTAAHFVSRGTSLLTDSICWML